MLETTATAQVNDTETTDQPKHRLLAFLEKIYNKEVGKISKTVKEFGFHHDLISKLRQMELISNEGHVWMWPDAPSMNLVKYIENTKYIKPEPKHVIESREKAEQLAGFDDTDLLREVIRRGYEVSKVVITKEVVKL